MVDLGSKFLSLVSEKEMKDTTFTFSLFVIRDTVVLTKGMLEHLFLHLFLGFPELPGLVVLTSLIFKT